MKGLDNLEIIGTAAGISEMAEFDARLFGQHKALSVAELDRISLNGLLLAVRDSAGAMIAEAQIITKAMPEAEEPLVRALPQTAGYFEGVAVDPEYSGMGLGLNLVMAVGNVLSDQQKLDCWATVRTENAPSLKNIFKAGYLVLGYSKNYYPGSDRLVVWRDLRPGKVNRHLAASGLTVSVEVTPGDEVDPVANQKIQQYLEQGFVGVDLHRVGDKAQITLVPLESPTLVASLSIVEERLDFLRANKVIQT